MADDLFCRQSNTAFTFRGWRDTSECSANPNTHSTCMVTYNKHLMYQWDISINWKEILLISMIFYTVMSVVVKLCHEWDTHEQLVVFWPFSVILCEAVKRKEQNNTHLVH